MTTLSPEQVAAVVSAGGAPAGTTVAEWVAKSRQESDHRSDVQDFLKSGHWGLWQIDEDHFGEPGQPGASSKSAYITGLKIPGFNFMAAKALYARGGWTHWRATGGKPTPNARDKAAAGAPDTSITEDTGEGGILPDNPLDALNPTDEVAALIMQPLNAISKWIGDPVNWIRIVQVAGGIALALVAVNIALRPAVNDIVKTIKPI